MAGQEANVKVKLDTGPALTALRGLTKTAAGTAKRVGAGVRGAVGRGLGVVGFGAAAGAAAAAVRGPTSSGVADVLGETLGGVGFQIAEFFFGDLNEKALADKAAREETIRVFGAQAGRLNAVPPGAREFFAQTRALRLQEEKGREIFEDPASGFRSTAANDLLERFGKMIDDLLTKAVNALADKLWPF